MSTWTPVILRLPPAVMAAGLLVAAGAQDTLAWVRRKLGFGPLAGTDIAALAGTRAGAGETVPVAGTPDTPSAAVQIIPGGYVPLSPVPLADQVIERTVARGRPPWDVETRAHPILREK